MTLELPSLLCTFKFSTKFRKTSFDSDSFENSKEVLVVPLTDGLTS